MAKDMGVDQAPDPFLAAVDAVPAPEPQPPAADPFLAAVDATQPNAPAPGVPAMRAADLASQDMAPDKAADIHRLSDQTGLPKDAISAHYDVVRAQAEANAYDYNHIAEHHAALADWLKEPVNAALARGDVPALTRLSEATQDLSRPPLPWWEAFLGGAQKSAKETYSQLIAGPAEVQNLVRSALGITDEPSAFSPLGDFYRIRDDLREKAENEAGYQTTLAKRTVSGLMGMAVDPLNLIVPGAGGAAATAERHLATAALESQSQSALLRLLNTTDHAVGSGLALGALSGGRAVVEGAEKQQGGTDTAANAMAQAAIGFIFGRYGSIFKVAGERPTLGSSAWDFGGQAVLGASLSAAGTAAETITGEHRLPTAGELGESAVTGGIGGAALSGVSSAMDLYLTRHHVENLRAIQKLRFDDQMKAAMQVLKESSAAEKSPEAITALADAIAAHNGLGNGQVFMQSKDFDAHHELNGRDPLSEAQRLGIGDDYLKAKSLGTDIQMPVGDALRMSLDEQKAPELSTQFRQDPLLPTSEEAEQRVKDQPQLQKELVEREAAFIAHQREPAAPGGPDFVEQFRQQALAAGESPEEAAGKAKLGETVMTRLAGLMNAERERVGAPLLTPQQLSDQFKLRIRAAVPELLDRAKAGGEFAKLFERLRKEGPQSATDEGARTALKKLGLDPLTMTDEQIHEGLKEHVAKTGESAPFEQSKDVRPGEPIKRADVPYGAGTSQDGKTVYIDHRIPRTLEIDGKTIDVHQLITDHELYEKPLMDAGESYAEAHKKATARERLKVEALGITFDDYEKALEPFLKAARDSFNERGVPADLEPRPYLDSGEEHLLERPEARKLEVPGEDLSKNILIWRWRKATGDRTPFQGKRGWDALVDAQMERDENPQPVVIRKDPLALPDHGAPSISERLADLKRDWTEEHGGAPADNDPEWQKRVADALADDMGRGTFFQTEGAGRSEMERTARGTFQIGADRQSIITLFAAANRSTVIHELGHYFLEVMGDLASRPDAPASLKEDFAKAMEFTGYGSRENMMAMKAQLDEVYQTIGNGVPTEGQRALIEHLAEPHEIFARSFERYLMEGVAPSKGLRRLFATIKGWMTSVYRDIRNLGVPLTDDIRGVFDRLLASEDEIAGAKERVEDNLAFTSREEAGASEAEWNSYHQLAQDAQRQERDTLAQSLMAIQRKAESDAYQAEHDNVRAQVAEQVGRQPVYDAMGILQNGRTWDGRVAPAAGEGRALKILRSDAAALLTPQELAALPGPAKGGATKANAGRSITSEKGLPANEVAEMLGYGHDGGQRLLKDLAAARDRDNVIDDQTAAEMRKRHPDPMQDPVALQQEADQALHGSHTRARLLEMEHRLLERRAATDAADRAEAKAAKAEGKIVAQRGQDQQQRERLAAQDEMRRMGSADRLKAINTAAKDEVGQTRIAALNPDKYTAAERAAGKEVAKAMKAKDYAAALDWKHKQLVNSELAREAQKAMTATGRDRAKLHKAATDIDYRQSFGKRAGWDWTVTKPDGTRSVFSETDATGLSAQEQARRAAINDGGTVRQSSPHLDQIDRILEGAQLKRPEPGSVPRGTLPEFVNRVTHDTDPQGKPYRNGITALIPDRFIREDPPVAYSKMSVNQLHETRAAIEAIQSMADQQHLLHTVGGDTDFLRAANEMVAGAMASQFKNPTRPHGGSSLLSGLKDVGTSFADSLIAIPRVVNEMDDFKAAGPWARNWSFPQAAAADAKYQMIRPLYEQIRAANKAWGKMNDLATHVAAKFPGLDHGLTLLDRIVLLRHFGNVEGRERINSLMKLRDDQVHAILKTLDAKDIAFANEMTRIESSHWGDIAAMEERYNGTAPPKVEAMPVALPSGVYEGGYQHIYYKGSNVTALEGYVNGCLDGDGYRRIVTAKGYTNARLEAVSEDKILDLSARNWVRSINEMAHDLTHRDLVVNQARLLSDKGVRAAIVDTRGAGDYQQFINQLKGIAESDKSAVAAWEKGLDWMRQSAATSSRSLNPVFMLAHASGFVNAIVKVGPMQVGRAMMEMGPLGPWSKTAQFIRDSSVNMRSRYDNLNAGLLPAVPGLTAFNQLLEHTGLAAVHKLWEYTELTTWKGAYDTHRAEGGEHGEAVRVADQAVNSTFGAHREMDKPEIHRTKEVFKKMIVASMSYDNAFLNQVITNVNLARRGAQQGDLSRFVKGAAGAVMLGVCSNLAWDYVSDTVRGEDMAKWSNLKDLGAKVALSPVSSMLRAVPILRELQPLMEGKHDPRVIGMNWLQHLFAAGSEIHQEFAGKTAPTGNARAKAALALVSDFIPLPAHQIMAGVEGLEYNQQNNEDLLHQVWRLLTGPPAKAH